MELVVRRISGIANWEGLHLEESRGLELSTTMEVDLMSFAFSVEISRNRVGVCGCVAWRWSIYYHRRTE